MVGRTAARSHGLLPNSDYCCLGAGVWESGVVVGDSADRARASRGFHEVARTAVQSVMTESEASRAEAMDCMEPFPGLPTHYSVQAYRDVGNDSAPVDSPRPVARFRGTHGGEPAIRPVRPVRIRGPLPDVAQHGAQAPTRRRAPPTCPHEPWTCRQAGQSSGPSGPGAPRLWARPAPEPRRPQCYSFKGSDLQERLPSPPRKRIAWIKASSSVSKWQRISVGF